MNILEIEGLGKVRKGFALQDVSLCIPAGYVMGLIGPNGAGKTTLIRLILNLLHKDDGSIRLFGMDNVLHEEEVKQRVGFVLDAPPYYDDISLQDNARIAVLFYRGWSPPRFHELLHTFGLQPRSRFGRLSHGQKMKFALAVALSHDAELIVMDEPTAGLDPVFRRELMDILGGLLLDGRRSILFSTHITTDIERIADYVTLLHEGRVLFSSTREELGERWRLVKGPLDLLDGDARGLFRGLRENSYGFEGLCDDAPAVHRRFGEKVVIERAGLEDILYHCCRGKRSA